MTRIPSSLLVVPLALVLAAPAARASPEVVSCGHAPPDMACVYGGRFLRGSNEPHACPQGENNGIPAQKPNHLPAGEVWVQTFYMDKTEVTFEAYQACVRAGKCKPAKPAYGADYSRPNQPMVGMAWFLARDYCKAMGKRLPSEAQWEHAARGPQNETFPWGNEPSTCERAVLMDAKGRSCGTPKQGSNPDKGRTLEVGSRAPGHYGLFDMAGNAEEYVNDWYVPSYEKCGAACAGDEPLGPCGGKDDCPGFTRKVVRGGSWYWPAGCTTGYHRRHHVPQNSPQYHHFGFRCAATIEEAAALAAAPKTP